ncbi:TIM barrel protein [Flagellimonas sp. DF-77]|uniref:sugar phosphate isomerase/epimerase family protein n=1 Tax=Flagellimonas algarum TaxID=3230298 RepID=UPI003390ECE9
MFSRLLSSLLLLVVFTPLELRSQEVGLQLYSLRNQFENDVPATFTLIKNWGITKIEGGAVTYGVSEERFKGLLQEHGLEVVSIGASYQELKKDPRIALDRAKGFGTRFVMCPWIPHGKRFTLKDAKKAVGVFNAAGQVLATAGITLLYHPHGYEFEAHAGGTVFDFMARSAQYFAFELDIFWARHAGVDPLDLLKAYPGQFKTLHLKDMRKGAVGDGTGRQDVEDSVALGTGSLAVAEIVKLARKQGVVYLFLEDESSAVLTQIPKSLAFLETID